MVYGGGATVMRWLRAEIGGLVNLLLPPVCLLCRGPLPSPAPRFCPSCLADMPPVASPRCPCCLLPLGGGPGDDHLCETCLRRPPDFSRVAAAGRYENSLRRAIHRFKFNGRFDLDGPLGTLLGEACERAFGSWRPDLVVPVPLHRRRLRRRSYNQALLLSAVLGRRWRVPVHRRGLVRTRDTAAQQGLSAVQRRRNLRGALTLGSGSLRDQGILLVDDVLTTGTTAGECSRLLVRGGAAEVRVAVLARAPRDRP